MWIKEKRTRSGGRSENRYKMKVAEVENRYKMKLLGGPGGSKRRVEDRGGGRG